MALFRKSKKKSGNTDENHMVASDAATEKASGQAKPSAHFAAKAKPETKAPEEGPLEPFVASPPALSRPDRADIGAMRLDVARISADIQSGEELYRRAQQRIENLTGFVERAEIDFSMLNRLEPENRRLKARNRTIEREMDSNQQKMDVLRADLEDREHRLAEKTRIYEATLGKLSIAQKSVQEYERALSTTRESSDRNALNSERLQTSLDVERKENEVLRNRIADIVSDTDAKQSAYIELQVDHLTKQLDIKDEIVRNAARDVQELRKIRTAQDLERERLEAHIETQSYQLDQAQSDLLQTKQDVTDFDRRYRDVATALSVSQARRMSNAPAASPDIQPQDDAEQHRVADVSQEIHAPTQEKIDEFDGLSGKDVEDRIMDFRLGLRKDLT